MQGVSRIDRVAAHFEVWLDAALFPFPKMKVKVLERSGGDFLAVTNVHRRNASSRHPEYVSGLGDNVESALQDLLERFVSDVRENSPHNALGEEDFEWSAPEDF